MSLCSDSLKDGVLLLDIVVVDVCWVQIDVDMLLRHSSQDSSRVDTFLFTSSHAYHECRLDYYGVSVTDLQKI